MFLLLIISKFNTSFSLLIRDVEQVSCVLKFSSSPQVSFDDLVRRVATGLIIWCHELEIQRVNVKLESNLKLKLPRGIFIVNIENMFVAIMFGMKSATGTLYAFVSHFTTCVSFYTLLKTSENQKNSGVFSGIELDQWHEISISWKGQFMINFFHDPLCSIEKLLEKKT